MKYRTIGTSPATARSVSVLSLGAMLFGSVTDEASLCVTWHSAAVKNWAELLTTEATFGGNGPGSDPDMFALLLKNLFGAKIKLITGYPGSNDITLAMERGEIDGYCGMSVSSLKSRHPSWLADKQLNVLVQAALRKHPDFPDVPLLSDIAKTAEERQIVRLVAASQEMARPFLAPRSSCSTWAQARSARSSPTRTVNSTSPNCRWPPSS